MKNKYQEALEKIMQINSDDFVDIGGYYAQPKWFKDNINILQELVDKETPMKVVKETINDSYDNNDRCVSFEWERIKCPKCNEDLVNEYEDRDWDNNDICPFCGQKLDWSDNNED